MERPVFGDIQAIESVRPRKMKRYRSARPETQLEMLRKHLGNLTYSCSECKANITLGNDFPAYCPFCQYPFR